MKSHATFYVLNRAITGIAVSFNGSSVFTTSQGECYSMGLLYREFFSNLALFYVMSCPDNFV